MSFDPASSLTDIVDNCERITGYLRGADRTAFERDGLKRDAVERCLERVCEAAVRLGDEAKALMPDQPWNEIRGMGNRLRHAYDRLSLDIMWDIVQRDVPGLAADARAALDRLPKR